MANFILKSDVSEVISTLPPGFIQKFSGKRVLITGGRGFLGRYFTAVFEKMNSMLALEEAPQCELVVLDNLITSGAEGEKFENTKRIAFVNHDIIKPFYPERPVDYILHAAGIASPYYYRKYPLETLEVATIGLKNVMELAMKQPGCKLSFFSSSEIYGDPDAKHVPTMESYRGNVSSLGPRACYDESKRLGETLVRIYHEKHGVHGTIIRPFNVYGPGMQKTDYRVLPNFGARIMEDKPLQIYGTGNQTRTFCYVTDAIRGFLQVLVDGESGEPYNIGNPEPEISMVALAEEIGNILGKKVRFDIVEYPDTYPADEPNRRCADITKARTQVGYEPHVTLQDGLKRFFSWASEAYR
jgi:UDP-glucuronate decarboxylase